MDEPPVSFAPGDRVQVSRSHPYSSRGRAGTVRGVSPEPYERARDENGLRRPRGLSTRFVWVVLDGEECGTPYWPESLLKVVWPPDGRGVTS